MNTNGFQYDAQSPKRPRPSSWVKTVFFNGEAITVETLENKSFDLLAVSVQEIERVKEACFRDLGLSIGAVLNTLIKVRKPDGSLKTEEANARVWG